MQTNAPSSVIQRPGNRGVGTRNYIVVMGDDRTYLRLREKTRRYVCRDCIEAYPNIDGIVAVTHTEGGESKTPNNIDMLLRTLAGFTVHPNIGAMLLVDYGTESVTNEMLKAYMAREGYVLDDVVHHFHRLHGSFDTDLAAGAKIINGWLDSVNSVPAYRTISGTPQNRLAVWRIGCVFWCIGQSACRLRCERGDPLWRLCQPRRNR